MACSIPIHHGAIGAALPACALLLTVPLAAQPVYPDPTQRVLTHREQAPLIKTWIERRFDTVLPDLMARTSIDMWIIVSREYNDDPVFRSMAPITTWIDGRQERFYLIEPGNKM
jgi:hypothetical protein